MTSSPPSEIADRPDPAVADRPNRRRVAAKWSRLSLREYLGLITIAMLASGLMISRVQLHRAQAIVLQMRAEVGYLSETDPGQIAAARAPTDQPLTYRVRVRTPSPVVGQARYRVVYSSLWPKSEASPDWYGAVPVPPGESLITVRIHEDPRDHRWKISTHVGTPRGTQRMATVLPLDHAKIFRQSHEVISTGVSRETLAVDSFRSIRLLDERWLVGEGSLLLYGDRAPDRDQIGVYVELQPDVDPI